VEKPAASALKT